MITEIGSREEFKRCLLDTVKVVRCHEGHVIVTADVFEIAAEDQLLALVRGKHCCLQVITELMIVRAQSTMLQVCDTESAGIMSKILGLSKHLFQ